MTFALLKRFENTICVCIDLKSIRNLYDSARLKVNQGPLKLYCKIYLKFDKDALNSRNSCLLFRMGPLFRVAKKMLH